MRYDEFKTIVNSVEDVNGVYYAKIVKGICVFSVAYKIDDATQDVILDHLCIEVPDYCDNKDMVRFDAVHKIVDLKQKDMSIDEFKRYIDSMYVKEEKDIRRRMKQLKALYLAKIEILKRNVKLIENDGLTML